MSNTYTPELTYYYEILHEKFIKVYPNWFFERYDAKNGKNISVYTDFDFNTFACVHLDNFGELQVEITNA